MKKRKIIIVIVIILGIIGFFIGNKFLNTNKTAAKQDKTQVTTLNQNKSITKEGNNTKADIVPKVNINDNAKVDTNNNEKVNTVAKENNTTVNTVTKANKVKVSVNEEKPQVATNSEKNENSQGQTSGVSVINVIPKQGFNDNSVIITNKSGKEVPENILGDAMRQWILKWQYSYSGFADYKNTVWGEPWLDTISNETLASTFVDANGQDSPYYNVTASELNSATVQLTENQLKKPWPLTYNQASDYIHNEFKKQFTNETITKIVQNSYGYDVYSNPYNEKNKYPIIVIEGATGYQSN